MPPCNAHSSRPTLPTAGRMVSASANPVPLFVYGTLLFPDVVRILIDRDPHRRPATVHGWRAAALPGRVYPALVHQVGSSTNGNLIEGLTADEWQTLDIFETDEYALTRITLTEGDHAWTYTYTDPTAVGPTTWNPDVFAEHHLPAYLDRCHSWRRHFDAARW